MVFRWKKLMISKSKKRNHKFAFGKIKFRCDYFIRLKWEKQSYNVTIWYCYSHNIILIWSEAATVLQIKTNKWLSPITSKARLKRKSEGMWKNIMICWCCLSNVNNVYVYVHLCVNVHIIFGVKWWEMYTYVRRKMI